ncbi:MAG TPA: ABC transporter substrate-binding protein, partial [Solirubrobacteraceae bacterium]|nr:ABC transporter substrate-binding protein [Solirubrobacteraceae bacterium]
MSALAGQPASTSRRHAVRALATVAIAATGLAAGGCGSAATPSSSRSIALSGVQTPLSEKQSGGRRGGTLIVLNHDDFEHIDPGEAYFSIDYQVVYATQRPLYSYRPNTFAAASPDLAEGPAKVSANGRTITVRIRAGVHFSPPVNREVTSADVAYAIERGANPNVANPYFHTYFSSLLGAGKADGGPIPGITTPNSRTIVFHLSEPKAAIVLAALALPLSAPVPREYAGRFDAKSPSEYGNYQVATGPYMFAANHAGKVLGVGYEPGKSATLVRNPNWNPRTDFRPAYLNRIEIKIGGDPNVIGRQVLEGQSMVQNEAPAQSIVQLAYEHFRPQLEISPGAGDHYIAVDNAHGPFANIDVRKAFWAVLDRTAMDKA